MNISRAFSFVSNDKDWISKLIIAGLISLIPIVGILYLTGWMMEIARRYHDSKTELLPEVNFGRYIANGFKVTVIGIVYSIPIAILGFFTQALSGLLSNTEQSAIQIIFVGMICTVGILIFILSIVLEAFLLAGYMRYVKTDNWKEAFNFPRIWKMVIENLKVIIILILLSMLAEIIGGLGVILCVIGLLFSMPYSMAFFAHAFGQGMLQVDERNNYY
jgi:hypothetical protein